MVKHKNPELFLELAKSLPMYNFAMVGGKGDPRLMLEIEKQAAKIENLEYLGHQSFEKVEGLFDQAAIFISTYSIATEGFPNTFLQAWSRGIPVVSSMDLDKLISRNNLGIVADSALGMKKAIQSLMSDKNLKEYSSRIQDVFTRKFSVPNRIHDFERILSE
jgi:glycosyltransferase involved in cell wall biosynthesis